MKNLKLTAYEILKAHYLEGKSNGVTTQQLSVALGTQRTHLSSLLNGLVREGLVIKTMTRPVKYFARGKDIFHESCFSTLIGHNGSLANAVQSAKATALYPEGCLFTLISGKQGTGKKMMCSLMHQYAIDSGVLKQESPYIELDCMQFASKDELTEVLYVKEQASKMGTLLISNLQSVNAQLRHRILNALEKGKLEADHPQLVVFLSLDELPDLSTRLPMTIHIPTLAERPLHERFNIVQSILTMEAEKAKRIIVVNAELMRCLLLYETDANISGLKLDIQAGCAKAYVREHQIDSDQMNLYLADFEFHIRKGFLHYNANKVEIEEIIPSNFSYRFAEKSFVKAELDGNEPQGHNPYEAIEEKTRQLENQGLSSEDISILLISELEAAHYQYQNELSNNVVNTDQLSKLVDARILSIAKEFLDNAEHELGRTYPPSVYYGLCLHLDSTLKASSRKMDIGEAKIKEVTDRYRLEYALSLQLAARLEAEYDIRLPEDEVVLLTLFICNQAKPMDTHNKPVVLYALRGPGHAKAYATLISQATQLDNAFDFEVPILGQPQDYYDNLCSFIRKINRGQGVLVFYDADAVRYILDAIEAETDIPVRKVFFPLTNIAFEASISAVKEKSIDVLFNSLQSKISSVFKQKGNVIITLCTTGEGGATELKKYVEKYGIDDVTRVIPLSSLSQSQLQEDVTRIMDVANILCIIGTHNPQLLGIPFIPISEVFSSSPEDLPNVLDVAKRLKNEKMAGFDYEGIFDYLADSLEYVKIDKLRRLLPVVMQDVNDKINTLSYDTEIGLFLHIACGIERILSSGSNPVCIQKKQILTKYCDEYKTLTKILKPLEKAYRIVFSENDLALILSIIYQL